MHRSRRSFPGLEGRIDRPQRSAVVGPHFDAAKRQAKGQSDTGKKRLGHNHHISAAGLASAMMSSFVVAHKHRMSCFARRQGDAARLTTAAR